MERGAISSALIGHYFGAFIIEAYEYPEIKAYIERIRKNYQQPEAFEDFKRVAKAVESRSAFRKARRIRQRPRAPNKPINKEEVHLHEDRSRRRPDRTFRAGRALRGHRRE